VIDRRTFLGTLAGGLLAAPLAAWAQPAAKMPRIGVLVPAEPDDPNEPNVGTFRQTLRDLGYVEGKNIAVDYRYAHGRNDLAPSIIQEFIHLNVDAMVIASDVPAIAAKEATQKIPIVFIGVGDPVAARLVTSLARPGGNVTGLSMRLGEGFVGKLIELLKEASPTISRVGWLRTSPSGEQYLREAQRATKVLGLGLVVLNIRELHDLDAALATLSQPRGGSFITLGQPLLFPHRSGITEIAAKYRLPAIYSLRVFTDAGGLMSYGPSLPDLWRRAALYMDRVLKGARPAEMPVEEPTKYELVINLKTAKALGLTIPPSLVQRADQVIE